jgi:deazaflavin-dependent oxidoreductase (nitroreductase family)
MVDVNRWKEQNVDVIAEFRANAGVVGGRYAGRPMMLLTTKGAKSGQERITPLNYSADGTRIVVIASRGGAPTHPDWYRNLVANPEVTVEVGAEKYRARAYTAQEPERTRLFDQQAALMPFFDEYRKQVTAREIPVVVFERLD